MAAALQDPFPSDFSRSPLSLRADSEGEATACATLSAINQLQEGQSALSGVTGTRHAFIIQVLLIEANGQKVALPLASCCAVELNLYRAIGVEGHLHIRRLACNQCPGRRLCVLK